MTAELKQSVIGSKDVRFILSADRERIVDQFESAITSRQKQVICRRENVSFELATKWTTLRAIGKPLRARLRRWSQTDKARVLKKFDSAKSDSERAQILERERVDLASIIRWRRLQALGKPLDNVARTLGDIRIYAKTKFGRCLTRGKDSDAAPSHNSHLWFCFVHSHTWSATVQSVVGSGSWCQKCWDDRRGVKRRKYTLGRVWSLAAEKGLTCLQPGEASDFVRRQDTFDWSCIEHSYPWSQTLGNVIRTKNCCAQGVQQKRGSTQLFDIEVARKAAIVYGGELTSAVYKNIDARLWWRCKEGHRFPRSLYHIQGGRWCLTCDGSAPKTEAMVRVCFEFFFNDLFPTSKPLWLASQYARGRLHLDGLGQKNKRIAFEYDGRQHRALVSKFKMTDVHLAENKKRDRRKTALCQANGIILIRVAEIEGRRPSAVFKLTIVAICRKLRGVAGYKRFVKRLERMKHLQVPPELERQMQLIKEAGRRTKRKGHALDEVVTDFVAQVPTIEGTPSQNAKSRCLTGTPP